MRILVLGLLGVERVDGTISYVRGFQAVLIAELLAADSMVVSTDRLADALYGEDAPRQPLRAVHAHVTRLRRALRLWEPEGPGAERLLTKATGYALKVSALESDAGEFLAELSRARTHTDAEAVVAILEPALRSWRGPVLEGTPMGAGSGRLASRLEAARREAAEQLALARLELGQYAQAVADLEDGLLENPYDESLSRLLMTALLRSGRPSEAQRVEQRIRRASRDGLGGPLPVVPRQRQPREADQQPIRHPVDRILCQRQPLQRSGRWGPEWSSARLLELLVDHGPPVRLDGSSPVPGDGPVVAHRGPVDVAGIYRIGGSPVTVVSVVGDAAPGHSRDGQGIVRILEYARKARLPVAVLVGEPGHRPGTGAGASARQVRLLHSLVQLRGVVPRVMVSFDEAVMRSPVAAALGDACVLVRPDQPGPDSCPTAEIETASVLEGAASARDLLHFLIRHWAPAPPPRATLERFVSHGSRVDMRTAIAGIADAGDWLEIRAGHSPSLLTGLARIEGKRVCIVANNPLVSDGALTPEAVGKGARMVDLCALWNIPLLVLVDTPPLPGGDVSGVGSMLEMPGSDLLRAFLSAQVPKVTVIVGQAQGWARLVMGAGESGADAVYAWPQAQTDVADGALDGRIAPQATRAVVSTLLGAYPGRMVGV
ncbi:carboxyl transferase domain-containing protein [Streptomyces sp. NPDC048527]|uniref:carboxyl transferase domain-containing protein n=1 Tax=Streptomyces sp. NPDC048527 TaxID=3365568 RepID=UPI00371367BF